MARARERWFAAREAHAVVLWAVSSGRMPYVMLAEMTRCLARAHAAAVRAGIDSRDLAL